MTGVGSRATSGAKPVMNEALMIVGAGGHARSVAILAALTPGLTVVGVADRTAATLGERIGSAQVVATFADMPRWRSDGIELVALAVGDNAEREALFNQALACGLRPVTLIHPSVICDPEGTIGEGTVICAGAILGPHVRLGRGVIINTGSILDHECQVDDFAQIATGSRLAGRVRVGARAFLGIGCAVIDKKRIGIGAVIGAGAVVISDIPDGRTAVGVPARLKDTKEDGLR